MKFLKRAISLLLLVFAFTKCTTNSVSPEAQEIGIEQQNEDAFYGKTTIDNSVISYSIIAKSELLFNVSLVINKKEIQASVNFEDESISINGYDNILTEQEKDHTLLLGKTIADYLLDTKEGDISMAEYTLLSFLEYWSKSPKNYQYSKRKVTTPLNTTNLKSRNEGITCIKKNSYVNAEYDDSRGNHRDRVKVGSKPRANYGCMGRCGGDCGRWWIPSAWTKDCMDHDQCSNVNNASGGGSDRNCGDEFNEAADDYIFGVIRGCRG
ncbi:hypothetical protein D1816_01640 [Aquimarina sp. AD10]|uniref:DUF8213 domain-containing protein n=1 Tax=Aquimarina aggregata TaxID=1642818 RepID=A0A163B9X3_9FLAO|nr:MULTISPECIES: hypothetical protein [Aquimarina]AXT59102.1 hypothetical protein D1816_01640 [Aquimarina sp. AD10]KZS41170.1 hypothetical protein AWE51_23765 [Aquimarina aggregata]RKM93110.1 hypothetical protein D7033_20165 [Aquimarina sp. AD10]